MVPVGAISPPAGSLDEPTDATIREAGPLPVRGWALLPDEPVSTVLVLVDGEEVGRARLGLPRPDVAERTLAIQAPACGYGFVVENLPPGKHRIGAIAVGASGARHRLPEAMVRILPPVVASPASLPPPSPAPPASRVGDLHLLTFSHSISREGSTIQLLDLLPALQQRHPIRCSLVGPEEGSLVEAFRERGIPVHVTAGYGVTGPETYRSKVEELTAWARERSVDAVLANGTSSFVGVDVARALGVPSIQRSGGFLPLDAQLRDLHPDIHPLVLEQGHRAFGSADLIVFASETTRRMYVARGDVNEERTLCISTAIDLESIEDARERLSREEARKHLGLSMTATLILCTGAVIPRKGQTSLTVAFAGIAGKHPAAELVFLGGADPASARAIDEIARRAGLSARVRLAGATTEPWPWYAAADIAVCASDLEASPRVVFEALAFERPIVASDVGDLAEVLEGEAGAYLCRARDLDDLRRALDAALSASPEARAASAKAGRRIVIDRYDVRTHADRYAELLRALMPARA